MNYLKNLMLLILVNQLEKLTNTKIEEIGKYLTNELNKFSGEIFNKKLKQAKLATKNDIADKKDIF